MNNMKIIIIFILFLLFGLEGNGVYYKYTSVREGASKKVIYVPRENIVFYIQRNV